VGTPDSTRGAIPAPDVNDAQWNVWFDCTGGFYTCMTTEHLIDALLHGEHRITQVARFPKLPTKGPLGGECTCHT
jgi:hypothetical protein